MISKLNKQSIFLIYGRIRWLTDVQMPSGRCRPRFQPCPPFPLNSLVSPSGSRRILPYGIYNIKLNSCILNIGNTQFKIGNKFLPFRILAWIKFVDFLENSYIVLLCPARHANVYKRDLLRMLLMFQEGMQAKQLLKWFPNNIAKLQIQYLICLQNVITQ